MNKKNLLFKHMERVQSLISRMSFVLFDKQFTCNANFDKINGERIYLQISYYAPCTHTGVDNEWYGRKWYLSEYMLDDEIVKTAYCAFKTAVEHEVMEGFKIDGIVVFNPHVSYETLMQVSHLEVKRENK